MNGNKYETALAEVQSVLTEQTAMNSATVAVVAQQVVERLVAKGVIQSTDPDDLGYRTGPLEPGRKITGGWQPALPDRDAPLREP